MRPPCWRDGESCPNWCAQQYYERKVLNRHWLPEPWTGWRFAGRYLVNPHRERIVPQVLDRIMYRHSQLYRL